MIDFTCGCGKRYSVSESMAGKRARCRACKALIDMPVYVLPEATDPPFERSCRPTSP